jgi:hypothetical protein
MSMNVRYPEQELEESLRPIKERLAKAARMRARAKIQRWRDTVTRICDELGLAGRVGGQAKRALLKLPSQVPGPCYAELVDALAKTVYSITAHRLPDYEASKVLEMFCDQMRRR